MTSLTNWTILNQSILPTDNQKPFWRFYKTKSNNNYPWSFAELPFSYFTFLQTNGFFVECGGYDGESLSNTLYMERSFGWSGLLIEADKQAYSRLITRNRKVYASPVCLSTKPYPMQVIMLPHWYATDNISPTFFSFYGTVLGRL
jgi:hypothetical protein